MRSRSIGYRNRAEPSVSASGKSCLLIDHSRWDTAMPASARLRRTTRIGVSTQIAILFLAFAAQAQPRRIVSTFPSATETLFALGVGDRVVGVSTYCRYPPAVLSLPKVGTYIRPDAEKIALLRPDLVVVARAAPGLEDRLSSLGIRYASVKIGSLAEVYSMIHDIGAAVGAPDRADRLGNEIRSRLETIRAQNANRRKPTVLMVVGRTPGLLTNLIAVGPSTYLGELLQIAGGRNALSEAAIPYPHISMETVVRLNPDVILDLSMMGESGEPGPREEQLRQPWLPHRELAAVQNSMVFGLTSETLVTPGPRVADAVKLIDAKIHREGRP
jgi:iron complex transport system substrate-binding protein